MRNIGKLVSLALLVAVAFARTDGVESALKPKAD
jgi:hypothetical protein